MRPTVSSLLGQAWCVVLGKQRTMASVLLLFSALVVTVPWPQGLRLAVEVCSGVEAKSCSMLRVLDLLRPSASYMSSILTKLDSRHCGITGGPSPQGKRATRRVSELRCSVGHGLAVRCPLHIGAVSMCTFGKLAVLPLSRQWIHEHGRGYCLNGGTNK